LIGHGAFDHSMTRGSAVPGDDVSGYEALVEFLYLTPIGLVKFRADGGIDMANPAAAQLLLPLAPQRELNNIYAACAAIAPDLRTRVAGFRAPAGPICDQLQLTVPGTSRVLTLSINKINQDTLMAVIQDITRVIEQELRIRDDQQRFHAIFDNIRDYAIYTVDLQGRVDEWNRSMLRLGGWQPEDVAGATIDRFFTPSPLGVWPELTVLDRARLHGTTEFDGWCTRRDGTVFWGNTLITALPDPEGKAQGYVLVTRDLTERKHFEDRLVALATTDPLTGAANRRAGESRLDEAFAHWQNHRRPFTVLMIDCDHFKRINDRWGHKAGDAALVTLVRVCRDSLRPADCLVRWGGEEFLLLLPDSGREAAMPIAERLRVTIAAAEIIAADPAVAITVSIGMTESDPSDRSADDALRRADRALYCAKDAGRNRILVQ